MSESEKDNKILGKKRQPKSDSEEEDKINSTRKRQKTSVQKKKEEKEPDESSSSSSGSQPRQSLFGNNEKGFTGGLFGDLDNPQKETSLFGKPEEKQTSLFGKPGEKQTSLFGKPEDNQTSLFGKPEEKQTSLFGNTGGKLFGDLEEQKTGLFSGGLFDFSQINKKKDEEEENNNEDDGADDNIGKSNSPKHEYDPEKDNENEKDKDGYIKRYTKKVDNIFLYDKLRKTYISRGQGFLIIDTQETENEGEKKRFARILFRNSIGGIIFQGILNDNINKCVTYEKKLKHICHFIFLIKEDDEKNPLVLGQAKVPFSTLDDINLFSEKYNNSIKYIKNEINEF